MVDFVITTYCRNKIFDHACSEILEILFVSHTKRNWSTISLCWIRNFFIEHIWFLVFLYILNKAFVYSIKQKCSRLNWLGFNFLLIIKEWVFFAISQKKHQPFKILIWVNRNYPLPDNMSFLEIFGRPKNFKIV